MYEAEKYTKNYTLIDFQTILTLQKYLEFHKNGRFTYIKIATSKNHTDINIKIAVLNDILACPI